MRESDWLPPLAGRETNADNPPDQRAKWRENEKIKLPQPANVGVKRVTGLCILKNSGDEPGKRPKQKANPETSSSRGSAKNFKATDFASGVSESITVCASVYNERVCGKLVKVPDGKTRIRSYQESNRGAGFNY